MNVKAIMCDVDGTLLNSQGVVSEHTVDAIRKAREKGILFGLSTGRDVNSVKTLLKVWGIEGLVDIIVGTGGAEIYDYCLDQAKSNYPLDGRLIAMIMEHYADMEVNFAILKTVSFIRLRMTNSFKCWQQVTGCLMKWSISKIT